MGGRWVVLLGFPLSVWLRYFLLSGLGETWEVGQQQRELFLLSWKLPGGAGEEWGSGVKKQLEKNFVCRWFSWEFLVGRG